MSDPKCEITPDTKVGALLDAYPQLEERLLEMAPAFGKLRNPILRKSVGKIATLRQAAQVGGISLGTLITELRRAVGLDGADVASSHSDGDVPTEPPPWFSSARIVRTFDARPLLESGQHPIAVVMDHLNQFPADGMYELITPFIPTPLLDMAKKKGFASWSVTDGADCVRSYLKRTQTE